MKKLTLILILLLSGCATVYDLCIPMGNGICAKQYIRTYRQIAEVEIKYEPASKALTVSLKGVRSDPISEGIADLLKRAEISKTPL